MNKNTLTIVIFFCSFLALAQDMSYNQPWLSVIPGERSLAFGIPQRAVFSDVEGTPFANEAFVDGTLCGLENDKLKGRFRYNAYTNEIEKESESGPVALLRRDYYSITIGNDLYLIETFLDKGKIRRSYFVEKNKGRVRLLKKVRKEKSKVVFPGSSYRPERAAKFRDDISYYLKLDSGPAIKVDLKKKDLIKALPGHQKKLTTYVEENRLKLKTVPEVIQFLQYYNTL